MPMMDLQQWQEAKTMWLLLFHIQQNASDRKKRLLAVALCRHISKLFTPARWRVVLEWAKRLSALKDEVVPEGAKFPKYALEQAEKCADAEIWPEELAEVNNIADRLSFVAEYYYACY